MKLWPFFCFYGGKWRAGLHYPAPRHQIIIEPFAGAAGYSTRYPDCRIVLIDRDPIIIGIWNYLIKASVSDIEQLPTQVEHVDSLHCCQEAKWLIGFWLNKATTTPCKTPSAWMRSGIRPNSQWGEAIKTRIASQVQHIRHWIALEGSYEQVPNVEATWFIDPPYEKAGMHYRFHKINYAHLAEWSRTRRGQIIVCENTGASWLPFQHLGNFKSVESKRGKKVTSEAVWHD